MKAKKYDDGGRVREKDVKTMKDKNMDDRVYAGGNKNFDERTGTFRGGSNMSGMLANLKNKIGGALANMGRPPVTQPGPGMGRGQGIGRGPIVQPGPGVGPRPTLPPKPAPMKKGGKVGSASKRADGIAKKGKTRGKFV